MKKQMLGAVLAATTLFSSVAMAGVTQTAKTNVAGQFYVGANLGLAQADWKTMVGANTTGFTGWKHGKGGFTLGAYAGYMMNKHIGFEAGWNYLPKVDFTITYDSQQTATKLSNNVFYVAVMMANKLPIDHLSAFLKVGPGMQHVHLNNNASGALNNANTFGLFGAAGLTYSVTPHIGISAQAAGLSGQTNHETKKYSTNVYTYTISAAYLF